MVVKYYRQINLIVYNDPCMVAYGMQWNMHYTNCCVQCGLLTDKTLKMEQIYYWIGLVVFWLSATIGSIVAIGFLGRILLNELGRRFKTMWIMVEFAHYRKDFKEWVKDKKRHKKCESQHYTQRPYKSLRSCFYTTLLI